MKSKLMMFESHYIGLAYIRLVYPRHKPLILMILDLLITFAKEVKVFVATYTDCGVRVLAKEFPVRLSNKS